MIELERTGNGMPGPGGVDDPLEGKFLTFGLGDEEYGIEIRHVIEIIGIQSITDLPDVPDYVRGVINLRGKVIPVMDVRSRFGLPKRDFDGRTCIVVVDLDAEWVGLIVDSVSEVIGLPERRVDPPPTFGRERENRFIKGLGKADDQVIILLDTRSLLFGEDLRCVTESMLERTPDGGTD